MPKITRRGLFGVFAALPFVGRLKAPAAPKPVLAWRIPIQFCRGGDWKALCLDNPENTPTFKRLLGLNEAHSRGVVFADPKEVANRIERVKENAKKQGVQIASWRIGPHVRLWCQVHQPRVPMELATAEVIRDVEKGHLSLSGIAVVGTDGHQRRAGDIMNRRRESHA